LLVVDNGSSDHSLAVISEELASAAFPWRIITEPSPGVNSARNAGIRESRSDLLIFVDSDLQFRRGWFSAYLFAFKHFPQGHVFGGRVCVGSVEGAIPPWLDLSGPYCRTSIIVQMDLGDELKVVPLMNENGWGPVGPNMGFRRSLFEQVGMFDTRFGLRPGSLVPGAEAEFFDRLARAGISFVYVPDAVVCHIF
jgi:glycosyltransferase involved in cell wall biosynthesis